MSETASAGPGSGRLTFPCGACGADLEFAVGAEALRCSYCGHSETIPRSSEEITEQPFDEATVGRAATGWGADLKDIGCGMCGASFHVEPHVTSVSCPFCGSAQVEEHDTADDRLRPGSVIPFRIEKKEVSDRFKRWIRGLWFRPSALRHLALSDGVRGVYVPHWTFDALTYSFWTAEAGYHYYVTESYTAVENGETVTKTRQVRQTRWERVSGTHSALFDDVLVPASKGVDRALAKKLDFDTKALVPYQPHFLVGFGAEDYQVDVQEAWPEARSDMEGAIRAACARKVPGDTHRNLHVTTSFHNRTFKLCLLPLWVASYRYAGKSYRYLCNGQTGTVKGEAPWSWVKITAAALTLTAVIVALVLLLGGCAPHRAAEVYNVRPPGPSSAPALPADAPVELIDLSGDPAARYELVRERLPPNEEVARFNAIHRKGPTFGPLVDELKAFARARGADVVLVSCAPKEVDGEDALVCAGMLVRTEGAPSAP